MFRTLSREFLDMLLLQDRLLSSRPEFMLGSWLQQARNLGTTPEEKQLYEWNARTLITVWGDRNAADNGGLRDYSHREWSGLLRDFYYPRWKAWFDELEKRMDGSTPKQIDWFALEEPWTRLQNDYPTMAITEPVPVAREVFEKAFNK